MDSDRAAGGSAEADGADADGEAGGSDAADRTSSAGEAGGSAKAGCAGGSNADDGDNGDTHQSASADGAGSDGEAGEAGGLARFAEESNGTGGIARETGFDGVRVTAPNRREDGSTREARDGFRGDRLPLDFSSGLLGVGGTSFFSIFSLIEILGG